MFAAGESSKRFSGTIPNSPCEDLSKVQVRAVAEPTQGHSDGLHALVEKVFLFKGRAAFQRKAFSQ